MNSRGTRVAAEDLAHLPRAGRRASLAAAAAVLALVPAAQAAVRLVAPGGSDASDCLAVPCASIQRAYSVARRRRRHHRRAGLLRRPGDAVGGNKPVTVQGLPGNKIRQLKSDADNITFDGLDLDAGGEKTTGAVFEHGGGAAT